MTQGSLRAGNTFLLWHYEPADSGRLTKVPYSPLDGYKVGTDEKGRGRLSSYDTAKGALSTVLCHVQTPDGERLEKPDGIGFVFTRVSDNLSVCGIDVDHQDPDGDFVKAICAMFPNAYIERSPSGEGVHIVLLADVSRIPQKDGKLAPQYYSKNPKNGVESYIAGLTNRYFTFTGDAIQDGADTDQTDEFLKFLDLYMQKDTTRAGQAGGESQTNAVSDTTSNKGFTPPALSDWEILQKARTAQNGDKFKALFDGGDIGGYNGDDSAADMALMNLLAFWTGCNAGQMERLFSQSQLGRRDKWSRADYRQMTIERAIKDCGNVYNPQHDTTQKDFTLKPGDYSDVGQAEVFAREYGGSLRYSEATDFISYNGTFWEECKPKAQGLAQELTTRQLDEARKMVIAAEKELERLGIAETARHGTKKDKEKLSGNAEHYKAYSEWLAACNYRAYVIKERESRQIKAALHEVQPMVLIDIAQLDADPFLLNTPGATYDLRTEEERRHNPADYITRCTAVSPSDVGAELWDKFLLSVFVGDRALIDYVQRVGGLAAIGKVFVEQIVISHGDGKNGKSSFWNPIIKAFGSYAGFMSSDALTANCRHNVRPEIAELRGKRVVLARELQEGKRLDESILKKITSTDPIDGEKKYKSPFTFIPSHTPIMYTNFLPKIGSRDAGTKRRLCVVPFTAKFEGKGDVKNYGDYLFEHAGGAIMKWVIEGAKKVIDAKYHIEPPECVRRATQDYIDAFDWLTKFLEARCSVGDN
jgi:P4 family phage/plasmid primase-like protien